MSEASGGFPLDGAVAERGRQREKAPACARRQGGGEVAHGVEDKGHPDQHPSQPDPIVAPSRQGSRLDQEGPMPPMLTQFGQMESQREAKVDGQHRGVAVLGQVRQGLEALLAGGHRLAEGARSPALAPACWQ